MPCTSRHISLMSFKLEQKEEELFGKIQSLQVEINADSAHPIQDSEDGLLEMEERTSAHRHTHKTLKTTVPTRWNSVLNMIRSLLSLQKEVNEVLKRAGKALLCLQPEDIDILANLAKFLEDFEKFTLIVSEVSPNLSAVTLIRARIKKICATTAREPHLMKKIKEKIMKNVDKRLPVSDLVKASTVFDPAVRDIAMSTDECREVLKDLHDKLNNSR